MAAYHLIEWWKRYETTGPTGGLRQDLIEAVELFEKELRTVGIPTVNEMMSLSAERMQQIDKEINENRRNK